MTFKVFNHDSKQPYLLHKMDFVDSISQTTVFYFNFVKKALLLAYLLIEEVFFNVSANNLLISTYLLSDGLHKYPPLWTSQQGGRVFQHQKRQQSCFVNPSQIFELFFYVFFPTIGLLDKARQSSHHQCWQIHLHFRHQIPGKSTLKPEVTVNPKIR